MYRFKSQPAILLACTLACTAALSLRGEEATGASPAHLFPVVQNGRCGYIDGTGHIVVACRFAKAGCFAEGLAPVELNGKWGYIDRKGQFVIEPQFEGADGFSEDLARAWKGDKWGFVGRDGKWAIEPRFRREERIGEGQAGSLELDGFSGPFGSEDTLFNSPVRPPDVGRHWAFSDGLAVVQVDGRCGLINPQGRFILKPEYDGVWSFSQGLARVNRGLAKGIIGTWGFLDKTGNEVIHMQYDWAGDFSEGLAFVKTGNRWGAINAKGEFIIPLQSEWEPVRNFQEGFAPVRLVDLSQASEPSRPPLRMGFIDKKGTIVIRLGPDVIPWEGFRESRASVIVGGRAGYLNREGKFVIEPQFNLASEFHGGLALVAKNDENGDPLAVKYGYIDQNGRFVWTLTR